MGQYAYDKGHEAAEKGRDCAPPSADNLFNRLFGTTKDWEECADDYKEGYRDAVEEAVLESNRKKKH